jgi:hypothetical protein
MHDGDDGLRGRAVGRQRHGRMVVRKGEALNVLLHLALDVNAGRVGAGRGQSG